MYCVQTDLLPLPLLPEKAIPTSPFLVSVVQLLWFTLVCEASILKATQRSTSLNQVFKKKCFLPYTNPQMQQIISFYLL